MSIFSESCLSNCFHVCRQIIVSYSRMCCKISSLILINCHKSIEIKCYKVRELQAIIPKISIFASNCTEKSDWRYNAQNQSSLVTRNTRLQLYTMSLKIYTRKFMSLPLPVIFFNAPNEDGVTIKFNEHFPSKS